MKPENPIIIVDEEEFDRIDAIAKLKEEEVEKLAKEMFLRHVKSSGISMRFRINGVEKVMKERDFQYLIFLSCLLLHKFHSYSTTDLQSSL